MSTQSNQISLYKQLNEDMIEDVGLVFDQPIYSYELDEDSEVVYLELNEEFDGVLKVNSYDENWSPDIHNLILNQRIYIANVPRLFGENGITMRGNKIGLAAHIHSRTSNIQETIDIAEINCIADDFEYSFTHVFPKNYLRGKIEIDFFMYLKEINNYDTFQANHVGMKLSQENLYNLLIFVDGDGSIFPMNEINDPNEVLWELNYHWVDASQEPFDNSTVNLTINIGHPLFNQLKNGKQRVNKMLMGDIMLQSMAMIIQQVVIIEDYVLDDVEVGSNDSILSVVKYWVSTYEVDTSNIFSIKNSLRRRLEEDILL